MFVGDTEFISQVIPFQSLFSKLVDRITNCQRLEKFATYLVV